MPPHRSNSPQRVALQFILQDTTPLISPPSASSSHTPPSSARHSPAQQRLTRRQAVYRRPSRPRMSFPLMLYELASNTKYTWIRWHLSADPGRPGMIVELSDWDKFIITARPPDFRFGFSKRELAAKNFKEYKFEVLADGRRHQTDGDSACWSGYYHSTFQPDSRESIRNMRRRKWQENQPC